jgi:hypothetical protein
MKADERIYLEGTVRRSLELRDGLETTELRAGGRDIAVRSRELAVVLDSANWRHDFASWRWTRSDAEGVRNGFHQPDFDDSAWATVPVLHAIYDARYDGHAWFRQRFLVPERYAGRPLTLGLGGMDDEDWTGYVVHLNGVELASWRGNGRWRQPEAIVLDPGHAGYPALRWGRENVLAIEVAELRRPVPDGRDDEAEHFFFQGWLLDQFVTVGGPYRVIDRFDVVSIAREGSTLVVELSADGINATLCYQEGPDRHLRKAVTLTNTSDHLVRILDVVLEDLELNLGTDVTKGGRGVPVFAGPLFAGGEHPAIVNQGEPGRLRVVHLPGAGVEAGKQLVCPSVVLGAAADGEPAVGAFRAYLRHLRPRRRSRLTIYDTLGWTDYASEFPDRPRLTEALFDEAMAKLTELRHRGISFDLFAFDDWFDATDFMRFNPAQFPNGSAPLARRLDEAGIGVALWSATTQAAWSFHEVAGMDQAIAGGVARTCEWETPPDDLAAWDWDAVFAHTSMGQMRYCPAAEPFRSSLRRSLVKHVGDTAARAVKLDCAVLHCTSDEHGHMPGKYSVFAAHEAMRELVEELRTIAPELFVIWYWGFRSPWWLQYGDSLFDKGLKLEAASPASMPAPTWRPAVTLNSDQAARFASAVPLTMQDDLGVWLGNVPWANWMGKAGWRDAFVMAVARAGTVLSLWGDLWLLDDDDLDVLGRLLAYVRDQGETFLDVVEVGGDPWDAVPHGYAQPRPGGRGATVTVHNPSFDSARIQIDLTRIPGALAAREILELYPFPGAVSGLNGNCLNLELLPWEVRCVALLPKLPANARRGDTQPPSKKRDLALFGERTSNRNVMVFEGACDLPGVAVGDELVVWARVGRNGAWRYDPEPQSRMEIELHVDGTTVTPFVTPSIRSWNGPGCPWATFRVPLSEGHSGKRVEARLRARRDGELEFQVGAFVFNAWWTTRPSRFEAP